MPTLLLTGFGPFPGIRDNPSARLVRLAGPEPRWRLRGWHIVPHVFETRYDTVAIDMPRLVEAHRPDAILMIGVASRARWHRIETVARGRSSPLHPDASGRAGQGHGPTALRAGAIIHRLVAAIRAAGVDGRPSPSAGRYLCDFTFHLGLGLGPHDRVAFLHVPPGQLAQSERAVRAAIEAMTRHGA